MGTIYWKGDCKSTSAYNYICANWRISHSNSSHTTELWNFSSSIAVCCSSNMHYLSTKYEKNRFHWPNWDLKNAPYLMFLFRFTKRKFKDWPRITFWGCNWDHGLSIGLKVSDNVMMIPIRSPIFMKKKSSFNRIWFDLRKFLV